MDRGFSFYDYLKHSNNHVIILKSKHKIMYIEIYDTITRVFIKYTYKGNKNLKKYKWIYTGYNDIPKKYQNLVTKYVVMYKLL